MSETLTQDQRAFITRWIADLRSGRYKQAKLTLITGDETSLSLCCLGVAALTNAGYTMPDDIRSRDVEEMYGIVAEHQESCGDELIEDHRWTVMTGDIVDQKTLSDLNDNGASFDDIAEHVSKACMF